MENRIVYMTTPPLLFGNLRAFTDYFKLKYNTYSRFKMPFNYKGVEVHKTQTIKTTRKTKSPIYSRLTSPL